MSTVAEVAAIDIPKIEAKSTWQKLGVIPLLVILSVQAVLSARIMIGKQAGPDEARYIIAGHQLIYELLHGGGSPYYETYFSGAPDIWSPMAAIADHFGGLVEVRLLALSLMLVATTVLFFTCRRLFGYTAATMSAAIFGGLGLAHDIGVYGNYDSLALMFMAFATYSAVRSREMKWLFLVPIFLLLSNASKYMTLVFDPVVVAIAALQYADLGWKRVIKRTAILGGTTLALLVLSLYLAGTSYAKGVAYTTVARNSHNASFAGVFLSGRAIVDESWNWTGIIFVGGAVGALLYYLKTRDPLKTMLLVVFVFAGTIVTLEAIHLHSDQSMRQHDTFGAWFTSMAAGYALSFLVSGSWWTRVPGMMLVLALISFSWVHSIPIADSNFEGGGVISKHYYTIVLPYLRQPTGRLLIGYLAFGMSYDANVSVPWWRLFDDIYLKYPIPGRGGDSHGQTRGLACLSIKPHCMYLEGPNAYRDAIKAHWFSFISLYKDHYDSSLDRVIAWNANHTPGYVEITDMGTAPTWVYVPHYRSKA